MRRYLEFFAPRDAADQAAPGADAGNANPDGGAAKAPAAGSGDPGAPAPGGPAGDPPGPDDGAAAVYHPEGIADHFKGKTDRETIDKLHEAYAGMRKEIAAAGNLGKMPKDASGYALEFSPEVQPYIEGLKDDPLLANVREAAFSAGMRDKQFNTFLDSVLKEMIGSDMVDMPFDPEAERALLAPDEKDPKKRAAVADAIVRDNTAMIESWKKDGGMPENVATFLTSSLDHAAANQLVAYIASQFGEAVPSAGGSAPGQVTEAALNKREADPRNRIGNPKYDPAFAAETTRLWQQLG